MTIYGTTNEGKLGIQVFKPFSLGCSDKIGHINKIGIMLEFWTFSEEFLTIGKMEILW